MIPLPAIKDKVLAIAAEVTVPAVAPPATDVPETYNIPEATAAGTDMETLFALIPTEAPPIPENTNTLL